MQSEPKGAKCAHVRSDLKCGVNGNAECESRNVPKRGVRKSECGAGRKRGNAECGTRNAEWAGAE
jgi:hypothetical protein